MIRNYSLLLGCIFIAFNTKAQLAFHIIGKLDSAFASSAMVLKYTDHHTKVSDTVFLDNMGAFAFRGVVTTPQIAQLKLITKDKQSDLTINGSREFLVEPGIVGVSGKTLKDAKITGSKMQHDYVKFDQESMELSSYYYKVYLNAKKYKRGKTNSLEDDYDAIVYFDELTDKYSDSLYSIRQDQKQLIQAFIRAHRKNQLAATVLLQSVSQLSTDTVLALYNNLSEDIIKDSINKDLSYMVSAFKLVPVGTVIPAFSLPDTSGNIIDVRSFKGKYTLVDFWASWCIPCLLETSYQKAAVYRFRKRGFNILAISLDQSAKNWKGSIKTNQLRWNHVSDLKAWHSSLLTTFGIFYIPQNLLIDPNGKVIAKNLSGPDLDHMLRHLIEFSS